MAEGSTRVVLVALAGNLGIALTKFAAAAFTGSSAMLTEAIHSLVDTGDQVLLLIGQRRAAKPADAAHPLGYGMETYFWSFIVALMVFLLGGAVSIWQGVHKLEHPAPVQHVWVSFAVLAASAVMEGASFMAAWREYRRMVRGRRLGGGGVWRFLRLSKDPNVFAVLLEDGAALTGLAVAALGVGLTAFLGWEWADGTASILIGLLLMVVALFMANETRSLIAGEAAAPDIVAEVRRRVKAEDRVLRVTDLMSVHLGPETILFAITLEFEPAGTGADIQKAVRAMITRVKAVDPRISMVFVRPARISPARGKRASRAEG